MILVTVGTNGTAFDRLLREVEALGNSEEVIVQYGPSTLRPSNARCIPFLAFDELARLVRRSRVVITHAGVGSILLSLAERRRPIVVPRLRRLGEAVDDHQLALGRRLAAEGLVVLVEDPHSLPEAVAGHAGVAPPSGLDGGKRLAGELAEYLREVAGRSRVV